MEFIVRVETRLAGKILETIDVAEIDRKAAGIGPEELGLTLAEGKYLLRQIQARIVKVQVEAVAAAARPCAQCGRYKPIKDIRTRLLRTLFCSVNVRCRRYVSCTCQGGKPLIEWPLRYVGSTRSTPELRYVLRKLGSTMPYRRAASIIGELLPLPGGISHTTVRRHTQAVGRHRRAGTRT
jgi:hypothetical protein